MASWTDIFNAAILPLGQREITSIDDQTPAARKCKAIYLVTADEVVGSHPWKCALGRAILAANATAPAFGPAYAYDLPTDPFCLRAWRVGIDDEAWFDDDSGRWDVEGDQILTDLEAPLYLRYIKRVTDPAALTGLLPAAIAALLRTRVAFPLTSSKEYEQAAQADYDKILREARSLDSQQGTPARLAESSILQARW